MCIVFCVIKSYKNSYVNIKHKTQKARNIFIIVLFFVLNMCNAIARLRTVNVFQFAPC